MNFLALEGGVCSGKTTTTMEFSRLDGVQVLPEYMSYVPTDHAAWKILLPPEERLNLFLRIDTERYLLIPKRAKGIIADRCILTIIAFEYAINRLGHPTRLPVFVENQDFKVNIPNHVIFFDVSSELRLKRWAARGADMDSPLVNESFNRELINCFRQLSTIVKITFLDATHLSITDLRSHVANAYSSLETRDSFVTASLRELVRRAFE